jgi:uncharacterized protein YbjT (DUF2867 family)
MKKAGSRENFRKVDYHYVIELAQWASQHNIQRIAVISSIGADPYSKNFYLRTKGEMEDALKALHLPNLVILRPSLLLGNRKEFRFGERLASALISPLSVLMIWKLKKYRAVHAKEVAKAMFYNTVNSNDRVRIIMNEQIA